MTRVKAITMSLLTGVVLAACGDNANLIGPSNQPQITNATDNFQYQASNLVDVSQVLTYTWANTGTSANVDQSGVVGSGTAVLILKDANGVERYNKSLRETGSFTSATGAAGNWTIEVRLTDVSGTLNFRVQKP